MRNKTKAKAAHKALKMLLKPKEKQIKAQGYESIDEFIEALEGVPLTDALKFQKEMDKKKKGV